jgi:glutathione S-transferase
MIRLYHCQDARSFRCLWALEELGLPYQLDVMRFPPRVSTPEYLTINASGTVPVLIDGNTVMTESAAILQYLATRHGPSSLAVSVDEPAYGDWLNWLHYGEATLLTTQSVVLRYKITEPEERRSSQVVADYSEIFGLRLMALDATLRQSSYLCADRFTVADISVHYALQLARFLELDQQFTPAIAEYAERLQQRDKFRAARRAQRVSKTGV